MADDADRRAAEAIRAWRDAAAATGVVRLEASAPAVWPHLEDIIAAAIREAVAAEREHLTGLLQMTARACRAMAESGDGPSSFDPEARARECECLIAALADRDAPKGGTA